MGKELSLYIQPKKAPNNLVFVGFYTKSSAMIKAFDTSFVGKDAKTIPFDDEDEDLVYTELTDDDYYLVKEYLSKLLVEHNEGIEYAKSMNNEIRDLLAKAMAKLYKTISNQ